MAVIQKFEGIKIFTDLKTLSGLQSYPNLITATEVFLLKEDGAFFLLEGGGRLILESV